MENEDMDEQLHPTENCEMQLFTSALISDKLLAKGAQDLMPSISLSVWFDDKWQSGGCAKNKEGIGST